MEQRYSSRAHCNEALWDHAKTQTEVQSSEFKKMVKNQDERRTAPRRNPMPRKLEKIC